MTKTRAWRLLALVMAFALVGLGASGPTLVTDAGAVAISYPDFARDLAGLVA